MPSLKADESFIEYLALGATSSHRAVEFLNDKGHQVIELERGALSSRIWQHKEKQLRVPDLLCIKCGRKIESRGKKNLEIKMSHSTSDEEREWDHDADDEDWVALLRCEKDGDHPRDWIPPEEVNIVSYEQLRETEDKTKQTRSGPTEGSELTIEWPSSTSTADGIVKQIKGDNDRVQISRDSDNYTLSYSLEKKIGDDEYAQLTPLVEPGERVPAETKFIAAPFEPISGDRLNCPANYPVEDWIEDLDSESFSDRFAAIKALGFLDVGEELDKLEEIISEEDAHPYAKIEAAASLARQDRSAGWDYFDQILSTASEDDSSERLEVIIILGEIDSQKSINRLQKVLTDSDEISELRAEAAHSLGMIGATSALEDLIQSLDNESDLIKRDCIEAIAKIVDGKDDELISGLSSDEANIRLGCALALAKTDIDTIREMIEQTDEVPKEGLTIALCLTDDSEAQTLIENLDIDDRMTFAVETISEFFNSWADELSDDIRYELRKDGTENEEEIQQATLEISPN